MITRVCEGQTNKLDTLIAETDWSFILSTHPRLPSRAGILRGSRHVWSGVTVLMIWRGRTADVRIGPKCWFSHDQSSHYSNCQRSLCHHLDQVGAIIRGTMKIVQQAVSRNRDLVECGGRPVRLQGRLDRRDPHDAAL